MRIKCLILLILMIAINLAAVENLGMFVEVKRYFDPNLNTRFDIDFQIPYKNMVFLDRNNGFFSEVDVKVEIAKKDSVVYTKDFTENIGVRNKYDVTSSGKTFIDRVSLTLSKPDFNFIITFTDLNSEKTYVWRYAAELLKKTDLLSDVEVLSKVSRDSTQYQKKFFRQGAYHIPEPSGIFDRAMTDTVFVYCEVNLANAGEKGIMTNLTLYRDSSLVMIKKYEFYPSSAKKHIFLSIPVTDLVFGRYRGTIEADDGVSRTVKDFEFVVSEQVEKLNFLFPDVEDEYTLMKYLANVKTTSAWQKMNKEAKRRYISMFWDTLAKQLNMSVDQTLSAYKDRIDYCNHHFSHFDPGWKTDMGRVYIRKGAPGEIEKDETGDDTKYVRKDFQIWKYSKDGNPVYVFIDIQMNGNYKLIYVKTDEQETMKSDWRNYLGSDFDEDRLRN